MKSDPVYFLLFTLGLVGIIVSLVFRDTPVEDIGDWLAVASGTWLLARTYYTE